MWCERQAPGVAWVRLNLASHIKFLTINLQLTFRAFSLESDGLGVVIVRKQLVQMMSMTNGNCRYIGVIHFNSGSSTQVELILYSRCSLPLYSLIQQLLFYHYVHEYLPSSGFC